jgi:nitroreductase
MLLAATKAPSGGNLQPWRFLVVRDAATRGAIADIYRRAWEVYEATTRRLAHGILGKPGERALRAGAHLAATLGDVPVLIVIAIADLSAALRGSNPELGRLDKAGVVYASVYPAVQNLLLAASALGLATRLTTLYRLHEAELKALLDIPDTIETVALVPVGYADGPHRRRKRRPLGQVVYWDRWGCRRPGRSARDAEPAPALLGSNTGGAPRRRSH